jgi:hypothetical protein
VGAKQLALEIDRREQGTLGEVATYMEYAADRLQVADAGAGVRTRQQQAIDLLDRLIREAEDSERQQGGGSARSGGAPGQGDPRNQGSPRDGKDRSEVSPGQGEIGALHGAPKADPGEMWGKLPPAERERILQSLRDRFPSRYRQLVEQYYRSLAEEK